MGSPEGASSALWVTGFETPIIQASLASLGTMLNEGVPLPVIVKVGSSEPIAGVPDDFLLEKGEQLTAWRNVPGDGESVLLFDWGVAPDGQGLRAVNRLDGDALLKGPEADRRFMLFSEVAWREVGGSDGIPGQLRAVQERVWRAMSEQEEEARSLRQLARFLIHSSASVAEQGLYTAPTIQIAISKALPRLGLFPDSELFLSAGALEGRIRKNVRAAGGASLADDDLIERIGEATFTAKRLEAAGHDENEIKKLMTDLVMSIGPREIPLTALDLPLWLEVFEKPTKKTGVGGQIREQIASKDSSRVEEFDSLEIEEELDRGEQEAAEEFLAAEPPAGKPSLASLLPKSLQRRVDKIAYPTSLLVEDPLRALLRELTYFDEDEDGTVKLRVEGDRESGAWSRWLFAFLFGSSLHRVTSSSGLRLGLEVDPRLQDMVMPKLPPDDEPFDLGASWAELRLVVEMDGVGQRRFRWDPAGAPGLIALAALVWGYEVAPGEEFAGSFETFLEQFGDPRTWKREIPTEEYGVYAKELIGLRRRSLYELRHGLDWYSVVAYVDSWSELMRGARETLVPANAPLADLEDVVLSDVVRLSGNRLLLLATHPLRLRWLAEHHKRMVGLMTKALTEKLVLNSENSGLLFDALERVSPHGTPAVIVGPQSVAIPMRESAGHEEYAPVVQGGLESRDWLSTVDEAAIEEMVRVITDYVLTYPHKLDGLSVLLLDRNGDSFLPGRVAKRVRSKNPELRLRLIVFAPPESHHSIIRSFDDEFGGLNSGQGRFLPDVELLLRSWESNQPADLSGFEGSVDIALAPALFGTQINLNASTKDQDADAVGRYDPWTHSSARNLLESSENVVRELLPSASDELLETWSTLCVRHFRRSPVSREKLGNTDFFEMQVQFDRHQKLFLDLHGAAHWVVTLDAFVGRDQIDNLQNRPDIILVRPKVGKNESYTLVVSSQSGKQLVEKRLIPRLVDIGVAESAASAVPMAARIYSCGRNVAPGAVLRSLGIGTTVNEVVGLVVARYVAAKRYEIDVKRGGLAVWLSFDEQHRWFSRTNKTRADLGRFVFELMDDGHVELDILVVESKYRQEYDHGSAEEQLNRTVDMCLSAFSGGEESKDDRQFWLEELASAVENTSAAAVNEADLPARRKIGPASVDLEARIVEEVRSANLSLRSVDGVAIAIASRAGDGAPSPQPLGRHQLVRVNRPELKEVIDELCREVDPAADSREGVLRCGTAKASGQPPIPSGAALIDQESAAGAEGEVRPPTADRLPTQDTGTGSSLALQGGLGEENLRVRYNKALDVFGLHNVQVDSPDNINPWQEGPGFYILRFKPRPGTTVDKVLGRREDIFLALELPAGFAIRTSIDRGSVVFEIPKTAVEKYGVDAAELWRMCPVDDVSLRAPIGADIEGNPVEIDFSSADSPHLLVAGTTGSGKSVALETILRGLLRYDESAVRLRLVDPKGTELVDFEDSPHLDGEIGMDAEDAISILENAVHDMEERYALMKGVRARKLVEYNAKVESAERKPWIVIVLDEYADLTSDPDQKKAIEALLRRLTQKARAAGIHVIAATQRPSADVISTTIRSNFPAQLALRVKTASDSRIVMDATGAETLAGQGDALLNTAEGMVRLQVGLDSR